jgi:hypothetical protein
MRAKPSLRPARIKEPPYNRSRRGSSRVDPSAEGRSATVKHGRFIGIELSLGIGKMDGEVYRRPGRGSSYCGPRGVVACKLARRAEELSFHARLCLNAPPAKDLRAVRQHVRFVAVQFRD